MKKMTIGLVGLSFASANLGCGALAYSFRGALERCAELSQMHLELLIFSNVAPDDYVASSSSYVEEEYIRYSFKRPQTLLHVCREMHRCDVVFDFTEGDSFTDLYGVKRLLTTSVLKWTAIREGRAFVLGPQTFGPFSGHLAKKIAASIFPKTLVAWGRDEVSVEVAQSYGAPMVLSTTDIAFMLESDIVPLPPSGKPRAGINVSGLLWDDAGQDESRFGMSVDYRWYVEGLIERLQGVFEIHLVPHVVGGADVIDSDITLCNALAKRFGCVEAPRFGTPMHAKGYISNMDVFTGARMHATIGAFSSGVPTVPFAYSRKFADLFGVLGYGQFCVDGRASTTEEAVENTANLLLCSSEMRAAQQVGLRAANERLRLFECELANLLSRCAWDDRSGH